MAKVQVTINETLWNKHPKVVGRRAADKAEQVIGYAMMPAVPGFKTEDDAALWIADQVGSGTFTWVQIADGMYDIVLQMFGKILREYEQAKNGGVKYDAGKAMFRYFQEARDNPDIKTPEDQDRFFRACWERDHQDNDVSGWKADEHVLYPKDVR